MLNKLARKPTTNARRGYRSLHIWVERQKGKPNHCEKCGDTSDRRYHWANVSGEYKRELDYLDVHPWPHIERMRIDTLVQIKPLEE